MIVQIKKKVKKHIIKFFIVLCITILYSCFLYQIKVNAISIKLNKTKIELKENKTIRLKVTGTKKKIVWKSGNTKIATVNAKGLVKGKMQGKTKITAIVDNKKYICSVTVLSDFIVEKGVLLGYIGYGRNIVIPNYVKAIGESAFEWNDDLTSVTIPNGVTSIGDYAFWRCNSLVKVVLPNSLTQIGECAFSRCVLLTNITIPSKVKFIGEGAFYECSQLKDVEIKSPSVKFGSYVFEGTEWLDNQRDIDDLVVVNNTLIEGGTYVGIAAIPETVRDIAPYAFWGNEDLRGVIIPENVIEIGIYVFRGCENLKNVTIKANINISAGMFEDCYKLQNVYLANGITTIDEEAFLNCYSLDKVVVPDSVTEIKYGAFANCNSLQDITLSPNLTTISAATFYSCENLKEIIIPNGVMEIQEEAFGGCINLEKIVIPSTVTNIGRRVFDSCKKVLIYGKAGSYAENYARLNRIDFVAE